MYEKFGQFIDGKWQQSSSGETYEVINPCLLYTSDAADDA